MTQNTQGDTWEERLREEVPGMLHPGIYEMTVKFIQKELSKERAEGERQIWGEAVRRLKCYCGGTPKQACVVHRDDCGIGSFIEWLEDRLPTDSTEETKCDCGVCHKCHFTEETTNPNKD